MADKHKILRVTMTVDYLIPMHDEKVSGLDGRTIPQIIKEWFKNWPLSRHHASRESFEIGGSKKLVKVEVLKKKDEPHLFNFGPILGRQE